MKGIRMRGLWTIAACLASFIPAWAQNSQSPASVRREAFAGTWRLDVNKSEMGADHPESNYGFTKTFELKGSSVVQKDHEVNLDLVGISLPERTSTEELVPDGHEHTVQRPAFFPGLPPTPTEVTVQWQGDNLVVSESGQSFIGPINTLRRYYLSDDSTTLVEVITSRMTYGDSEQKLVFSRISESH